MHKGAFIFLLGHLVAARNAVCTAIAVVEGTRDNGPALGAREALEIEKPVSFC